ncbi:hypothetical protein ACFOWE_25110 [Planomonospora corallina]|uniref:DUF385 domain-containing protein n=1 Tax=Planomonospora corallina TaxID=1806052 RepID=A0ABV8IBK3_9ACTN
MVMHRPLAHRPSAPAPVPGPCTGPATGSGDGRGGGSGGGSGTGGLPEALRDRLVAPVVRRLLRSSLHDLLSGSVVLVTVRDRRTGREATVPADYVARGGELLLVSRRSERWWHDLDGGPDGGAPVRVLLRGRWWEGTASVSHDPHRVAETLLEMAAAPGRPAGAARPARARDGVGIRIRLDRPAVAEPYGTGSRRGLWRRWFLAATAGEAAGLVLPAAVAALLLVSGAVGPLLRAPVLILAGAGAGILLGLGQAFALRTALPAVPTGVWVRATAAGAVLAWSVGAVPVTLGGGPPVVPWPVLAAGCTAMAVSVGLLQWSVLRGHLGRAWWWIPASAAGRCAGLAAAALVTAPLRRPGPPPPLAVLTGSLGVLAMAAAVAAVTGVVLVVLVRRGPRSHRRGTAVPTA